MKPEFYAMLPGRAILSFPHEQDALRVAESELRILAPHRRKPGVIEVGRLMPTARVVESPGRYVDGIPFPFAIHSIEEEPVPDELVRAWELAGRRDVKLRALRQGLRDILAVMEIDCELYNDGIKARLEALLGGSDV